MGIHVMPPLFEMVIVPVGELYTANFYPDAHPEVTSVDGGVAQDNWNNTWASLVAAPGSWAQDTQDFGGPWIRSSRTTDMWTILEREILLFDTSIIPTNAAIQVVTLALWGYSKLDQLGILPDIGICKSAPASNIQLAGGDFDSLTSDVLANIIGYNDWAVGNWNYFSFNTDGKKAIVRGGITKLGVRNWNYDRSGIEPTYGYNLNSSLRFYHADHALGVIPTLTVSWKV